MKKLIACFAGLAGIAAFADASNPLIYFSTQGPDTYSDGTTVLDGERYALVWSEDGVFEGLDVSCNPVDANDKVFAVLPRAKGGRCPRTVFQIDSKVAPAGGEYAVYLLDTRIQGESGALDTLAPAKAAGTAIPAAVRSSANVSAATYKATTGSFGGADLKRASASTAAALPGENFAPVVTGIKVDDAYVYITARNASPLFTYDIQSGDDPAKVGKEGGTEKKAEVTSKGDDEVTLVFPKDEGAKFFKVRRN